MERPSLSASSPQQATVDHPRHPGLRQLGHPSQRGQPTRSADRSPRTTSPPSIPALQGAYVYGDFVTGLIFAARQKDGKATEHGTIHQQKGKVYQIASFGEDAEGELYLLPLVSNPPTKRDPLGGILQLVAE